MNPSQLAASYDLRGERVLASGQFAFENRYQDLVARATRAFMESALPPLRSGETATFLDLCCGTGAFSIYPAKRGYQVTGVDLSPKSIEAARWQARRNAVSYACGFQVGDVVEFLRSTRETYDVISIAGSLYYLDRAEVLPLIRQRLKPGGTFLCLETSGGNAIMNLYRRLRNRVKHHRDPQTLTQLLKPCDYRDVARVFDTSAIRYFDFLTLAVPLFRWNRTVAEQYHSSAQGLDRVLLNTLGLHRLAFKIGFIGRRD